MEAIIDNNKINSMRADHSLVARFTWLGLNTLQQSGCCSKQATAVPDYDGIKRSIANLPQDQRDMLKQALGAAKITVYVPTGNQVDTLEF